MIETPTEVSIDEIREKSRVMSSITLENERLRKEVDTLRFIISNKESHGLKWKKDWSDIMKGGAQDLVTLCNSLTYHELVDFVIYELINHALKAKRNRTVSDTDLPYTMIETIRETYYAVIKLGKEGVFTSLSPLAWNEVENIIKAKEMELKEEREKMMAQARERTEKRKSEE